MNNTVLKEQPITCSEVTRRTASEEEKRDDQHHSRPQYGSRTLLFDLRIRVLKWARQTGPLIDRKSTRLNSSHVAISYAVFCLKKKTKKPPMTYCTTKTHELSFD